LHKWRNSPCRDYFFGPWGYHIPYLITGVLNEHPRSAMKIMGEKKFPDLRKFYEDLKDGRQLD
jgi:4-hydroxy 2-oxovalerate aldolase